jgi:hypothetical protein
MAALGALMKLMAFVQKTRGGTAAAVAKAGGEIRSASSS